MSELSPSNIKQTHVILVKRRIVQKVGYCLMVRKRITYGIPLLLFCFMVGIVTASSETAVSYHIAISDAFPTLAEVDASVTLDFSAVYNVSDGTIMPNRSTNYLIAANPGTGTLTVNYNIDLPLLKRSGSRSESIDATSLLGDSPPIVIYNDEIVTITVTVHGRLTGQVTA